MKYRRDIDGLRALAVLPVILFHAHAPYFTGGFVGVDVFFVISGYLITTIIADDLEHDRFTYANFYERRARRILPALLLVVATTAAVVPWIVSPAQLSLFGERTLAVLFFVSNIHLALTDDYFADDAETNPFLHTWSLAIEEQYYILFPLLMVALWRTRKQSVIAVIFAISLLSLAAAEYLSRVSPGLSFNLLPTRAWELGAGALVALTHKRQIVIVGDGPLRRILPTVGVAMIAASILLFDSETIHPGLWTLMPVVGAVLIILTGGGKDPATWLLSTRPLVAIGLISYSLYLWHQPAIALFSHLRAGGMRPGHYAVAIAGSFILAWLTWRYVETPFRNRAKLPIRSVIRIGSAVTACLVGLSVASFATNGFAFRKPESVWRVLAYEGQNPAMQHKVGGFVCMSRAPSNACKTGDPSGRPGIALVGDSHAAALGGAFDAALMAIGRSGIEYSQSGCVFLPGFTRRDGKKERCAEFSEEVEKLLASPTIDTIFFAGRYTLQLEGKSFDNGEGGREREDIFGYIPLSAEGKEIAEDERQRLVKTAYRQLFEDLLAAGKRIVIIYPIPEVGWHVPRELAKRRTAGNFDPLTTSYARYVERNAGVFETFNAIPDNPNLVRVYPDRVFCHGPIQGRCVTHADDTLLYFDDDHVSKDGAERVVAEAIRAAETAWPDFAGKNAQQAPATN
ncbi:MAG: acyltransferase family protein [Mesorhizobium sp.]